MCVCINENFHIEYMLDFARDILDTVRKRFLEKGRPDLYEWFLSQLSNSLFLSFFFLWSGID